MFVLSCVKDELIFSSTSAATSPVNSFEGPMILTVKEAALLTPLSVENIAESDTALSNEMISLM